MIVSRTGARGWRLGAISLAAALGASCGGTRDVTRVVTVHVSSRCPAPDQPFGVYHATGDFEPSPSTPAQAQLFLQPGATLDGIPAQTRSLALDVVDRTSASWLGVTGVPVEGDVDVLLWPAGQACSLSAAACVQTATRCVPSQAPNVGAISARRVLVAGGTASAQATPASYLVDLDLGTVSALPSGLLTPRARATVTPFGDGGLVAGGVRAEDAAAALDNAEVWDANVGDFDGKPIALSVARHDHGAVQLVTGDTLLVGGVGPDGSVLASLERVDPQDRRATASGMPLLAVPRMRPVVVRLADGTVMVAGGFQDATATQPVGTLEFFSADGRTPLASGAVVPARPRYAAVALDGGGALYVAAPVASDPADFQSVWIVSADRAVAPGHAVEGALTDPRLFPGAEGRPVLWTGKPDASTPGRWLRWDPWQERFDVLADSQLDPAGPPAGAPTASPDPGLLLWLDSDASVTGRRFSIRNAFATDTTTLLAQAGTDLLSPDRAPSLAGMVFDSASGLALPVGASVFVSDARFLDVTVDVDAPADGAPHVVLRSDDGREVEVGGVTCPTPAVALPAKLHVERRGATVTYRWGDTAGACPAGPAQGVRVAVGLRGGPARAKNLRVSRGP